MDNGTNAERADKAPQLVRAAEEATTTKAETEVKLAREANAGGHLARVAKAVNVTGTQLLFSNMNVK